MSLSTYMYLCEAHILLPKLFSPNSGLNPVLSLNTRVVVVVFKIGLGIICSHFLIIKIKSNKFSVHKQLNAYVFCVNEPWLG